MVRDESSVLYYLATARTDQRFIVDNMVAHQYTKLMGVDARPVPGTSLNWAYLKITKPLST